MTAARAPVPVPGVTLCAADCQTPALGARALERSLGLCRFEDAILFSDTALAGGFRHVPIPRIASMDAYQEFTTRHLGPLIRTSHALVVQWDGYVVDAGAWDGAFLEWDYVGAVWRGQPAGRNVGNSGFSLQSARLLAAVATFKRPFAMADDLFICQQIRPDLERNFGIRFAPPEVATRFSHEGQAHPNPTFGFHGLVAMAKYLTDTELPAILADLPPSLLQGLPYAGMVMAMLRTSRYECVRMTWRRAAQAGCEARLVENIGTIFRDPARAEPFVALIRRIVADGEA